MLIALLSHESRLIRHEALVTLCRIGPPGQAALVPELLHTREKYLP